MAAGRSQRKEDLDIITLEKFLEEVFNSPLLSDAIKKDTYKIIHCLIYIYKNIDFICDAVTHKDQIKYYENPKLWRGHNPERDKKNGVLRDDEGTAFHINGYKLAEEARRDLLENNVGQIAALLRQLTAEQRLGFARRLEFDSSNSDPGCLGKRTERSVMWGGRVLHAPFPYLDDIMWDCQSIYESSKKQDASFLGLVKRFCEENKYNTCITHNENKEITDELLSDYIGNVLGMDRDDVKPAPEPNEKVIEPFMPANHIRLGQQGMVQYHFTNQTVAEKWVGELKKNPALKNTKIEKAKASHESCTHLSTETCFIVRLNQAQIDAYFDERIYDELIAIGKLDFSKPTIELIELKDKFLPSPAILLNHLAVLKITNGWSMLQIIARYQSADAFKTFIEKLKPETCNQAALLKNNEGWSTLQTIARSQSADAFKAFVEKLNPETCNQAALLKNNDGWSVLQAIACYQSADAFKAFVEKLTPETCNQAALLKNNDKISILQIIARYQSADAFKAFVEKLTPKICAETIFVKDTFETITEYQNPENFKLLLDKVREGERGGPGSRRYLINSLDYDEIFKIVILFQPWENIKEFFDLVDFGIIRNYAKYFEDNIQNKNNRLILLALQEKVNFNDAEKEVELKVLLKPLLIYQASHPLILPQQKKDYTPAETTVLDTFKKGDALVKIISDWATKNDINKEDPWKDFIKQHKNNYEYRPLLRNPAIKQGFKFDHMEKEVIPMDVPEVRAEKKKKKKRTHTKKNSYTLISKKYHTPLFGMRDERREMIGILVNADRMIPNNKKRVILKMLLKRDFGTYLREWINENRNAVENYATQVQDISFNNYDSFKKAIDETPNITNEVLAQTNVKSWEAIIIGRDTPKAREIARLRRKDIIKEFNKELPIVFYDPEYRHVRIYTALEQKIDAVYDKIVSTENLPPERSLFTMLFHRDRVELNISGINKQILKNDARLIKASIEQARKADVSLEDCWNKIEEICQIQNKPDAPAAKPR